jgi:hypothetical protein
MLVSGRRNAPNPTRGCDCGFWLGHRFRGRVGAAYLGRRRRILEDTSKMGGARKFRRLFQLLSRVLHQVSSIQFWLRSGGSVSERGPDSPYPNHRGITDEKSRLMVVITHNTDIPDTWEREGESVEYFERFSPAGYAIGVNAVLYGITH